MLILIFGEKVTIADPICTFLFSILVLITTLQTFKTCISVLMEGVPADFSLQELEAQISHIEGIQEIHDLHVWSISSNKLSMTAHIYGSNPSKILRQATLICKDFKIYHSTLQIEDSKEVSLYDGKKCQSASMH